MADRTLSYPRVVVLVVACCWLAGVVGWRIGRDDDGPGGEVDAGFLVDMRTHHEQALQLSLLELGRGENPVVLGFAREVILFQSRQLGWMDANLEERGIDPGERPDVAMGWMDAGVPWPQMPGLATEEELAGLRGLGGNDADARFLELMAVHHAGGVHMADYAAAEAESAEVRDMATFIAQTQRVEVNEYIDVAEREGLPADIEPVPPAHGGH